MHWATDLIIKADKIDVDKEIRIQINDIMDKTSRTGIRTPISFGR